MTRLTRSKAVFAAPCVVGAAVAAVAACTGEDPVFTNESDGGPASIEASTNADAGTSSETSTDAGSDGAPDAGSCGARDTTPCGCGPSNDCCIGTGAAVCVPAGTGTPDSGCESTTTLDCVGSTCGGGRVCCYNGSVSPGAVCPKRMTAFDTRCVDEDNDGGPQCVELPGTPSARLHELTCLVDGDCAQYDAGSCVSALMDGVKRVMGVCVR
jgi:hypothetical protein